MERQRRKKTSSTPPAAIPSAAPAALAAPSGVRVVSGAFDEALEVAGMSVMAVCQMLGPDLGLGGALRALIDGHPVDADHLLQAGETLEVTPIVGEKGAAA